MTPTQERCCMVLRHAPYAISADAIGMMMKPRLGRIAVTSAMRALERQGLAIRLSPRDQWSTAKWVLSAPGKAKFAE